MCTFACVPACISTDIYIYIERCIYISTCTYACTYLSSFVCILILYKYLQLHLYVCLYKYTRALPVLCLGLSKEIRQVEGPKEW